MKHISSPKSNMLGAPTKHGNTLGQHHEQIKKSLQKWNWIDRYYHEIMLASMMIELLLLLTLVILEIIRN